MSDGGSRFDGAYDGGDMLNGAYFLLSFPRDSPFEKYLRSITLSKNRFNLAEFVVPVARLLASWQFKQITSAPHCSARKRIFCCCCYFSHNYFIMVLILVTISHFN